MNIKIQKNILKQFGTAAILSLIQMVNGYTIGWSTSMNIKLLDAEETPLSRAATDTEVSWITNIIFFGVIGTYTSSYFSNRIGRKYSFTLGGIFYCFSYLFITFARSFVMVMIGRLFLGFSFSVMQLLVYVYIGEIASPNIRGIITTLLSVFYCTGGLISYCVGPYVSYVQFGIVPIILTIVFTILSYFLNESPVYYVIKNNEEGAKKTLHYFGRSKDIDHELKIMFDNAKDNAQTKRIWLEMFKKTNRKAFSIIIPLYLIEQGSGVMAVMLNATAIFKIAGSSVEPAVASMIMGATNLVGSLISPFAVDRYGRRCLLFISTCGCCLTLNALGTYFYFRQISTESVSSLGWLPLTALVVALFTYNLGLGIIPHSVAGEMFSPNIRGIGTSIGMTCANVSGLVTTSIYNYLVLNVGTHIAFWMFAVIDGIGFLFTALVVPETKGKSLTEINVMLSK